MPSTPLKAIEWKRNNKDKTKAHRDKFRTTLSGMMTIAKIRLRRRAPLTDITTHDLKDQWLKQGGRCVLTGQVMLLRAGKQHLRSASIDRIDQKKPYSKKNFRWVTYQVNMARSFGSDIELIAMCKAVVRRSAFK